MTEKDSISLKSNAIHVELVTTMEQLQHVYAIRAICFMEEHGVAAQLAMDGNDLQATHVVIYDGEEPFGAVRIRWFKDFAKLERMAFRKAYRSPKNIKVMAKFVFAHIGRKGYAKVVTHAAPAYARLWRILLDFKETGKSPAQYTGHEPYLELVRDIAVPENAITMESDSMILFRTEGAWDVASQYEQR